MNRARDVTSPSAKLFTMIYAKLTSKARDSGAHEIFRGMPSYA